MKLDQYTHHKVMLDVLMGIAKDAFLANNLGFKGGTACYFVYGLNRFSVDLDFDILNKEKENEVREKFLKMLKKFGTVKTKTSIKLKYSQKYQSLKMDLSNRYERSDNNTYKVQDIISGVSLKVLQAEDIFAHKLFALTNRSIENTKENKFIANRDLYDINFFFENRWQYNSKIIEKQTGKEIRKYLQELRKFIEEVVDEKNILERLGDLVDTKQRQWIKKNLKDAVLRHLAIEIEAMR